MKGIVLNRWNQIFFLCIVSMLLSDSFGSVFAQENVSVQAAQVVESPSAEVIHGHCLGWIKENASKEQLDSWQQLIAEKYLAEHPLELIIKTISIPDEQTRAIAIKLPTMPAHAIPSALEKYQPRMNDLWMESNLRLWLGRELSQRQLYEEALQQLVQVDPMDAVDPAVYFFHRAVCEHHLLLKADALDSLNSLLSGCKPLPSRYRMVGELMKQDIAKLEEKSLDGISRKMTDVKRRLDLGRAGEKVQKIEREIVESLDELIKKLEEQAGAAGGAGSGSGNQPNSAAKDSSVKGSTAPGTVDDKDLGRKDGWGKLPPKDQAKAKQILGTLFPPHYRRAIEAYNRKAAQRKAPNP